MAIVTRCLLHLLPALTFMARFRYGRSPDDAAAALGGMVCCFAFVIVPIVAVCANIFMLIWVARDSKSRGMDAAGWLILIFFTGLIGLIIYLCSRPGGELVRCSNCDNNRMAASVKCPHCGARRDRRRSARREEEDEDEDEEFDDQRYDEEPERPAPKYPDREVVKQPDSYVVVCPGCSTRLRFPRQQQAGIRTYACPKCHGVIKPGEM
jgi:predicted RNA-binding Zn-ribbon protein involved in translation (DUF1610 family)/DNA-directed RNA polymerase subunit RPC12/RpoP